MLWFGENPKEAVDALRLHHQLIPEVLRYDADMPDLILNALREKGDTNQTVYDAGTFSAVQAIQIDGDGTRWPYSDYRKPAARSDGF